MVLPFAATVLIAAFLAAPPLESQQVAKAPGKTSPHFQTSDRCLACHNGISTPAGEDISIGFAWRSSMMANAARDPYWQASVKRESIDHPAARAVIEDECSICHMPAARYEAKLAGRMGEVFSHLPFDPDQPADRLAMDGVTCSVCHQIEKDNLGSRESFVGGFRIDPQTPWGERKVYGPYQIDPGHTRIMNSSSEFRPTQADHIRQSELCATCHTLYTKALGPQGQVLGELPEQVPYQEWLNSDFKGTRSCQDCHMPVVNQDVPITSVLGQPRPGVKRHVFVGGNFLMQRMLNLHRTDLSVAALPQELTDAASRTVAHLQSETARITIDRAEIRGGRLEVDLSVSNMGGHKLPTAYPSRRAWLHLRVRDRQGNVLFESGALDAKGRVQGNDNDADAARYEPHYREITSAEQVQIYESIMVDQGGAVTTGLLSAVRFVKDNRLLPRGFDKRTASADIAVKGGAAEDDDFSGAGDRIRYLVDAGNAPGPLQIEAELWFQPISYRWAENLRRFQAEETRRFVGYYDAMASASAIMLARATAER